MKPVEEETFAGGGETFAGEIVLDVETREEEDDEDDCMPDDARPGEDDRTRRMLWGK